MSIIRRHQRETGHLRVTSQRGSWTYEDPVEHEVALRLELSRFPLAEIDDWIEAQRWPTAADMQKIMRARRRLIKSVVDHDYELSEVLTDAMSWAVGVAVSLPRARVHRKAQQKARKRPNKPRNTTTSGEPKTEPADREKMFAAYKKFCEQKPSGYGGLKALSARFGVTTRQARNILNSMKKSPG